MSEVDRALTIVEQLHRATEELTADYPVSNRLALILIDNARRVDNTSPLLGPSEK